MVADFRAGQAAMQTALNNHLVHDVADFKERLTRIETLLEK